MDNPAGCPRAHPQAVGCPQAPQGPTTTSSNKQDKNDKALPLAPASCPYQRPQRRYFTRSNQPHPYNRLRATQQPIEIGHVPEITGHVRRNTQQAYAAKNVKDILRLCDAHSVDHLTPVGGTPLMLAARAGNTVLINALIEKGADPNAEDEFGHTPWQQAVSRAIEEPAFAKVALAPLFERIVPAVIDVQVDGRLVRLEHHQGEYWALTLMLAGLKTQWSRCAARSQPPWKYGDGFFAEQLHRVLEALPVHLWKAQRRKRSYVNQVLARAEVDSAYRPARTLWARTRNGHYLPNPAMLLRKGEGWRPVYEALNLEWIDQGAGYEGVYWTRPAVVVARLKDHLAGARDEFF